MSEAQSLAAKEAWARRREREAASAAAAADAAAEAIPDEAVQAMQAEISAGSSDDDTPRPQPKADHSARLAALEEVRKAREAEEAAPVTHEEPSPAEQEVVAPQQEQETDETEEVEAIEYVRVKVDGEEMDVPKVDVEAEGGVKAYQINKAAEKRLQKAAEIARANAEMFARTQAALQAATPPPPPQKPLSELIKEKIAHVQFGTPDEAAAAIDEIIAAKTGPAIDHNKMRQEAVESVFEHMAAQTFIQRNQDILNDRVTAQLALLTQNDMLSQQGRPQDWNQFFFHLETNLRNRLGKPPIATQAQATPNAQPTSGTVADKEARKASIVALPTASARAVAPEEPKPKTREQMLADMRKARGQPV